MRYTTPQIEDIGETAFTERIELAEIRNTGEMLILRDAYGRVFDFTRRLFVATSRHDSSLATYYHLDDSGNFIRAEDLKDKGFQQ